MATKDGSLGQNSVAADAASQAEIEANAHLVGGPAESNGVAEAATPVPSEQSPDNPKADTDEYVCPVCGQNPCVTEYDY